MGRVTRVFHREGTQTSLVKIGTREPINECVPFYLRDVGGHRFQPPFLPSDQRTDGRIISRNFLSLLFPLPRFQFVARFDSTFSSDEVDPPLRRESVRSTIIREKNSILRDRKKVPTRMCKTMGQCQSTIMVAAECDSPTSLRSTHLVSLFASLSLSSLLPSIAINATFIPHFYSNANYFNIFAA